MKLTPSVDAKGLCGRLEWFGLKGLGIIRPRPKLMSAIAMEREKPITVTELARMKKSAEPISCLTVYDYSFASMMDKAGVEVLLVGDSLGMVIQGHTTTLPVTVDEVIYHTRSVVRGTQTALIMADMPFGSFQKSPRDAFANASRLLGEGGAHMVKIEGGTLMCETVAFLVERGIPVCGHIGLTPQAVNQLGGFKTQGRDESAAESLRQDAISLCEAGVSLLILEAMPRELGRLITESVSAPTLGIGAGPDTDGQVLVLYDALGFYPKKSPKFSKNFLDGAGSAAEGIQNFVSAVRNREFPAAEHFL